MDIRKNIPIPDNFKKKYNFGSLSIGDSVKLDNSKLRYAIYSALRWYNKKNSTNIRIKTAKEGNTVAFWRIE